MYEIPVQFNSKFFHFVDVMANPFDKFRYWTYVNRMTTLNSSPNLATSHQNAAFSNQVRTGNSSWTHGLRKIHLLNGAYKH